MEGAEKEGFNGFGGLSGVLLKVDQLLYDICKLRFPSLGGYGLFGTKIVVGV